MPNHATTAPEFTLPDFTLAGLPVAVNMGRKHGSPQR
jgi:hypothetical protein